MPEWLRLPRWPWYQWLFLGLALLYVVPFWVVRYVPTIDGPCHLYNAWILRHYGDTAHYPMVNRYFELLPKPFPNWLSHLLLAGLMWVFPPLVSEKLLLSGYVLLFLGGLWYLAGAVDPERRWLAYFGFLFVFSLSLQFGFYNFCYSLGLFAIAVGYWWRRRDSLDLAAAVKLNLLLWLCYFAHIISTVLALAAIAVLWLATLRRENFKRRLLHLVALAPQTILPLWFLSAQGSTVYPAEEGFRSLWPAFVHFSVFFGIEEQTRLGVGLEVVFALLVALSVGTRLRKWRQLPPLPPLAAAPAIGGTPGRSAALPAGRREPAAASDLGFLLLAVGLAVLYFVGPEGMSGGSLLKMRLAAYPWLVLIPWLAPGLRGLARGAAIGALALLAVLNLGYVVHCYRQLATRLQPFISGLDKAESHTVVVPLLFARYGSCSRAGYLGHTIDYAALAKDLVDWNNYEAVTGYFPLRFKEFANHDTYTVEATPGDVRPRELMEQADYVYCWKIQPGQRIRRRLRNYFTLVAAGDDYELYQSPRLHPAAAGQR
jgi:hypothetical protein